MSGGLSAALGASGGRKEAGSPGSPLAGIAG